MYSGTFGESYEFIQFRLLVGKEGINPNLFEIAVHCHAGTGRTGVAIVGWLIYGEGMSAKDGIALFKEKRASSLSKTSHRDLLRKFE